MAHPFRKVTLLLPEELLEKALGATGEGVTSTVRQGLELVAAQAAFDGLRRRRGTVDLKLDIRALRNDKKG